MREVQTTPRLQYEHETIEQATIFSTSLLEVQLKAPALHNSRPPPSSDSSTHLPDSTQQHQSVAPIMSLLTTPAYIIHLTPGTDDTSYRSHPALSFFFDHKEAFDSGAMRSRPFTDYHTADFTFTSPAGVTSPPGEASWQAFVGMHAPFAEHFHDARYCCVYERDGGWEMVGIADVCGNLVVEGEKRVTGRDGRRWDVISPGAFMFRCVRDEEGLKGFRVKEMSIFGDGTGVLGEMVKRGMVKVEDLGK